VDYCAAFFARKIVTSGFCYLTNASAALVRNNPKVFCTLLEVDYCAAFFARKIVASCFCYLTNASAALIRNNRKVASTHTIGYG